MIKPNETKTWPSGTAFNIAEAAVGIQLFSVWIHFPFINTSMCINKMKAAPGNQSMRNSDLRADAPVSPTHISDVRPEPSSQSDIFSQVKDKRGVEARR